jgi:hypothetical protein
LRSCFRTHLALQVENLALPHQVTLLQHGRKRLPRNATDRFLPLCRSRLWMGLWMGLCPRHLQTRYGDTLASHRIPPLLALRLGCCQVPQDVQDLIHKMSLANPLWGAPRIHGELLKLGLPLSQATVANYMVHTGKLPSPR